MKFSEKRPIAWAVLVACALISIFGFGGGSMASKRTAIEDQLYVIDGMDYNLKRVATAAATMATEGKIMLGQDDATAIEMAELAETLDGDKDVAKRAEALDKLKADRETLYAAMNASGFADDKLVSFKRADKEFSSAMEALRQDERMEGDASYNERARDYNGDIKGFPASLVMKLLGKGELATFELN